MASKVIDADTKRDLQAVSAAVGAILNKYERFTIVKEGNSTVGFADLNGERVNFVTSFQSFEAF